MTKTQTNIVNMLRKAGRKVAVIDATICPNCGKADMQIRVVRDINPQCLSPEIIHCNYCGCEREAR